MKKINVLIFGIFFCAAMLCGNGAIAAKGGNKPQAAASAEVKLVIVDRVNQQIVVEGSGLLGAIFTLGGETVSPDTTTDTSAEISFLSVGAANVVTSAGNYNLIVNGETAFSIFIDGAIVDPGLSGCPCETEWDAELDPNNRTWVDTGSCIEIGTQIAGNISDTGNVTTLTIGAVYDATNSPDSVCSLTEINAIGMPTTLISHPVNSTQQNDCASDIKTKLTCTTL